jgi:hypothetical protein
VVEVEIGIFTNVLPHVSTMHSAILMMG